MSEASTRLHVRPLPENIRSVDVEDLFAKFGDVVDVKVMRNYGFVEFREAADAAKAVEGLSGRDFEGQSLEVQYSRPRRERDDRDRRDDRREPRAPRPVATHRIKVAELPGDASWQDLKDFIRGADVEVVYTDVSRERDGTGVVDFASKEEMDKAITQLNGTELKGASIRLEEDENGPPPPRAPRSNRGGRFDRGGRFGGRDRYGDRDRGYDRDRRGYDRYGDRGDRDRGDRDRGYRDRGSRGDRGDRGGRFGGRDRDYRDRSRSPNRYDRGGRDSRDDRDYRRDDRDDRRDDRRDHDDRDFRDNDRRDDGPAPPPSEPVTRDDNSEPSW